MANVKNRKPLLFPPLISDTARISHDSDSDDDEGHSKNKEVVKVVNFRCSSFLKVCSSFSISSFLHLSKNFFLFGRSKGSRCFVVCLILLKIFKTSHHMNILAV